MSEATLSRVRRWAPERALSAKVGVSVIVAAVALVTYAAYGDPHPKSSQEAAVPFLAVISTALAILVFGALVPRTLRRIEAGEARAARWTSGHGIVAALSIVAFWSGVPLVLGVAAALLGSQGRRQAMATATGARPHTVALSLGLFAAVGSVALTVIGNLTH